MGYHVSYSHVGSFLLFSNSTGSLFTIKGLRDFLKHIFRYKRNAFTYKPATIPMPVKTGLSY